MAYSVFTLKEKQIQMRINPFCVIGYFVRSCRRERGDGGDGWVDGVKSDIYTFWPVTRLHGQSVTLKLLIKRSLSKDSWSVRGG